MQVQTGGTLVIRPDSGDPIKVVRSLTAPGSKICTTTNSKSYKLLPSYATHSGDGINPTSMGAAN